MNADIDTKRAEVSDVSDRPLPELHPRQQVVFMVSTPS